MKSVHTPPMVLDFFCFHFHFHFHFNRLFGFLWILFIDIGLTYNVVFFNFSFWANRFALKLNQIWVILLSVATKPWIIYDRSLYIFPLYARAVRVYVCVCVSILKYIYSICHTMAMVISNSIYSFVVAIVVDCVFILSFFFEFFS